ncbi:hypothetical protein CEUSTIGMA_g2746.t1 [Chlamydomonas eustigma]|uniref:3-beta hydroxysteroid dehydrogenase/isomerase domain-containing protein n=1 Tax=Chlamydomonas eustigma TaxID=1157962 RepID=A0A250WWV4_9CHLO|nr:hypothetical protein CEUSTIGMA_g2746.t1 [Chlamydomonas eustigma]|eukprot:GAX75301.1 hypothetical protein CEUSTIGMA_g2746.t1 [Chlamydomonas eustigma]
MSFASGNIVQEGLNKTVPKYANFPSSWCVVGGSGTLGTVLIDYLIEAGAQSIKVLDLRPYSGRYASDPRVISVVGSASDRSKADQAVQDCTAVVMAVTPHISTAPWGLFVSANVHGTQTLLNASRASGCVKAFIAVSSIAVYNHFVEHFNADESFKLPEIDEYRSPYDLTKRLAEDLVLQSDEDRPGGMRTVALRPGGILMGPADYALEGFFKQGVTPFEGKPIDFTFGRNVCHAIALAAGDLLNSEGSKAAGKALLVSKGEAASIGQVCRDLGRRLNKKVPVVPSLIMFMVSIHSMIKHAYLSVFYPHKAPGIPTHQFLAISNYTQTFDNSLARKLIGFEPTYSYSETLDVIAEMHKRSLKKSG